MIRQRILGQWGVVLLVCTLFATASVVLRAQSRVEPTKATVVHAPTGPTVQEALNRPFTFPFVKPTSLEEAAAYLGKQLNAPVAIDRAAIERLELKLDDPVQLQLEGVRLKTGLKLLLDQLDLTFQVIPEDNLLIITDAQGSEDRYDRILTEIKSLHREMHDVQDAIDALTKAISLDADLGAQMRKPTIIEEVPEGEEPKTKQEPRQPVTPRPRPGI